MLSGPELIDLATNEYIDGESHIASAYEMRAGQLGSLIEAGLGISFGSIVAIGLAVFVAGVRGRESRILLAAGVAFGMSGLVYTVRSFIQLTNLREESRHAKELFNRLKELA
jgi:hypothetical protein